MAESSSGSGNWWEGWIQAAKEKSAQTLELIKHDLNEFTAVCTHDASAVVSSTTEKLQGSLQNDGDGEASSGAAMVRKGITGLLGGISRVLTVPPDDDDQDDMLRVTSSGNFEVFDKAKARLYEIQTSPQTYCTEPDGSVDKFNEWCSTFDLESKKGEISELLVSVNEVRSIYTKLVPSAVSHSDFWQRYYYKVWQLEEDEKRKAELKKRADQLKSDDMEESWEDDWDNDDVVPQNLTDSSPSKVSTDTATPLATLPLSEHTVQGGDVESTIQSATQRHNTENVQLNNSKTVDPSIPSTITPPLSQLAENMASLISISDIPDIQTKKDELIAKPKHSEVTTDLVVPTTTDPVVPTTTDPVVPTTTDPVVPTTKGIIVPTTTDTVVHATTDVEMLSTTDTVVSSTAKTVVPNANANSTGTASDKVNKIGYKFESEQITQLQKLTATDSSSTLTSSEITIAKLEAAVSDKVAADNDTIKEVLVKEKRGYVMVGSERPTPSSSIGSSNAKESSSGLDDEWDKELFGDDMKAVQELAEQIGAGKSDVNIDVDEDDWESWD